MLLSFSVSNHRSIRDEQTLHLQPVYDKSRPALPVAAIFGANAAGKSNLLDALSFMTDAVRHSFGRWDHGVPQKPFLLDTKHDALPSLFAVELLLGGVRYVYGFTADRRRIQQEWLHAFPMHRKRVVFERTDDELKLGSVATNDRRKIELIGELTPPNALLLNVAGRSGLEEVAPVHQWFADRVSVVSPLASVLDEAALAEEISRGRHGPHIVTLSRAADIGITGIEQGVALKVGSTEFLIDHRTIAYAGGRIGLETLSGEPVDSETEARLLFSHGVNGVYLSLRDQSNGTKVWLSYLLPVLRCLDQGSLLVIDEIDTSLHPRLTAQLVDLFRSQDTNPRGAQLVFTTHDASLLGLRLGEQILGRDEVWFVEKGSGGDSTLYALADFKPRKEENTERRYLTGAYGAVPTLFDGDFRDAVEHLHEAG